MKSVLVAGVIAAGLSMPALAASQAPYSSFVMSSAAAPMTEVLPFPALAASASGLSIVGAMPHAMGDAGGLTSLDLDAPVTRVVSAPPSTARSPSDDDIEREGNAAANETSTYALMLAGVAVLLFIATRIRDD